MSLIKYPRVPSYAIALLVLIASTSVAVVVFDQLNPRMAAAPAKQDPAKQDPAKQDPAKQESTSRIPLPLAAAIVQFCALVSTVLVAFFPIQSAAFHQAKKHVLEEILSRIDQYEEQLQAIYDALYHHQTTTEFADNAAYEASRAKISKQQKLSQAIRQCICHFLPSEDATTLEDKSGKWWSGMFGEEGWVDSINERLLSTDPQCTNMETAHRELIIYLGKLRKQCIFEQIKYWESTQNKG